MTRPRLLLLDTAHRSGLIALAEGNEVVGRHVLAETRRHARDLVPSLRDLLLAQGWRARDLHAVIVSLGPGSYTGLRVGLMSAKTLAYAGDCTLLGIETFAAIAQQAPPNVETLVVLADAQQERAYVQMFKRVEGVMQATMKLAIEPRADWLPWLSPTTHVAGPGVETFTAWIAPDVPRVPPELCLPRAESLLNLGLSRLERGERDDPFVLEPLYLRPSAAEVQWAALGKA